MDGSRPAPRPQSPAWIRPLAWVVVVAMLLGVGLYVFRSLRNLPGDAVESAVRAVLAEGKTLTYDLVGTERAAKMSAVTDAVLTQLS